MTLKRMRVAIVAESFLPNINGVTNSVLRVLEYLDDNGHEAIVIAPAARDGQEEREHYRGFRIERVPTVMVPLVDSLPIGVPEANMASILRKFRPDVVHLASPFVLGAAGAFAAKALRIPAVAVYQTDVAGFAKNYRLAGLSTAAWGWTRIIHNSCQRTLAPSSPTIADLEKHRIRNVHRWGRGVDADRFHPDNRSEALRRLWSPEGKPIVGYVGRLAAEKSVQRLAAISGRDDVQLVIVGDGPERADLMRRMPDAVFTGQLTGDDLAQAFASLDVFVHTGDHETFCQAVQEAHASGVPAIAPNAGGPRDLITPGVNGDLLEPRAFTRELAGAVGRLVFPGEPARAAAMRATCRGTIRDRTWTALCDQLMGHYAAVSGAHPEIRRSSRVA